MVGAGLTGLWTAYYLLREDPSMRVVVLEAETAGFGASGRNGGWCSALFPASLATLAASRAPGTRVAQHEAMRSTVDEVLAVAAAEGIDARAKGGMVCSPAARAVDRASATSPTPARGVRRGRPTPADDREARARPRHPRPRGHLHPPLRRDPSRPGWSGAWRRGAAARGRCSSAPRSGSTRAA